MKGDVTDYCHKEGTPISVGEMSSTQSPGDEYTVCANYPETTKNTCISVTSVTASSTGYGDLNPPAVPPPPSYVWSEADLARIRLKREKAIEQRERLRHIRKASKRRNR